jgi:anti-anti-sigma regulatory factor
MTTLVSQNLIRLKEAIGSNLFLRAHADELFDYIDSRRNTPFIIDFNGIQSISRSFAHEFLYRFDESKNVITLTNEPENVKKIFNIVREPKQKFIVASPNSKIVFL